MLDSSAFAEATADKRCSILDARCSILDTRCWILDAGFTGGVFFIVDKGGAGVVNCGLTGRRYPRDAPDD